MLPESTSIYTNNFREAYEQMNTTKIISLNSSLLQDGPLNQLNSVSNTFNYNYSFLGHLVYMNQDLDLSIQLCISLINT
jgi:hypothetical protein